MKEPISEKAAEQNPLSSADVKNKGAVGATPADVSSEGELEWWDEPLHFQPDPNYKYAPVLGATIPTILFYHPHSQKAIFSYLKDQLIKYSTNPNNFLFEVDCDAHAQHNPGKNCLILTVYLVRRK